MEIDLDELLKNLEDPPLPPWQVGSSRRTHSWDHTLHLAAEKRLDWKPACHAIDLRVVSHLQKLSIRTVLGILQSEYPQGWLASDQDVIDPNAPLPPYIPLAYWIPLKGGLGKWYEFAMGDLDSL